MPHRPLLEKLIPQGSVLGPLLFLIYIDGISNLSLSWEVCSVTFADDVCILYRPLYRRDDYKLVQEDIAAIERWSDENFLTLNPQKCKYMLILSSYSSCNSTFTPQPRAQ